MDYRAESALIIFRLIPHPVRSVRRRMHSTQRRSIVLAALPLAVVVAVNLLMSFIILARMDTAFLAEPCWAQHRYRLWAGCGR